MELLLELIIKFLWDLCKDAAKLFIITEIKKWLRKFFESQPTYTSYMNNSILLSNKV